MSTSFWTPTSLDPWGSSWPGGEWLDPPPLGGFSSSRNTRPPPKTGGWPRAQYDVAAAVFAQLDPEGTGRIAKQLLLPSLRRLRLHVSLQQARDVMRTVRGPEMGFDQFARWWVGPPGAETLDA